MANSGTDLDWLTSKLQSTTLPKESGVSFAGKGLKLNGAVDAQAIIEEINNAEKVEFLNMEGNSLGVEAAKEIGKALGTKKEFRKALWKDMFTSRLKNEIPIALKHLGDGLMLAGAKLEILDLSDNASGPIGVEGFEDLLRSPTCYTLRELRLNNMGLGVTGAKKLASALLDLYNNSKNAGEPLKLEVFIAGRNRLENPGATALAQVFQKIGTLKEISIPQNGIYHPGVAALSAAFNENLSLEVINLNDNTVTEKGAKSLSKVLCNLTNLKSLDLGDCLLRSEGASAIAESLGSLRHLETLNLSFNEIKGTAGSKVLHPLAPISTLTLINLDGNMFGSQVTEELESIAEDLNLPLGSFEEDEGDGGDDDEDYDQVDEEEEDDDDGDEEEDEDAEDTESDQPYNIGSGNKEMEGSSERDVSLVASLLETLSLSKYDETATSNPSTVMSVDDLNTNKNYGELEESPIILHSVEPNIIINEIKLNQSLSDNISVKLNSPKNKIELDKNDSLNKTGVECHNNLNQGIEHQMETESISTKTSKNEPVKNIFETNDLKSLKFNNLINNSLEFPENLIVQTQNNEKLNIQSDIVQQNTCLTIVEQYKTIIPCDVVSSSIESVSFHHGNVIINPVKSEEVILNETNNGDNDQKKPIVCNYFNEQLVDEPLQNGCEFTDKPKSSIAQPQSSTNIQKGDKSINFDSSKCTIL